MDLPIYLQPGQVVIYGRGLTTASVQGLVPEITTNLFGVIQQVWDGGNINAQIGSSVLFKDEDVTCRLAFNNYPYTIIEQAKLVLTEQPPV